VELKGKIREKGMTYRSLAPKLGMSYNTLSDKLNGHFAFDTDEISRIVAELNIKPNEIVRYFFPHMMEKLIRDLYKEI
jgi:Helix-turn-helix.